jgi:phosphoglucomutase
MPLNTQVSVSPLAGKPADPASLVHVPMLVTTYHTEKPDPSVLTQRVSFRTAGHRGSAFACALNEWHILAIRQAICLYRAQKRIDGPLFLGLDTHALSVPTMASALEVLAATGVIGQPLGRAQGAARARGRCASALPRA